MKIKYLLFCVLLLTIPSVAAQTVDAEIANIVAIAEQYELGNVDYLELLIQASLAREKVNEILGSFTTEEQGPSGITPEAAERFFGIPRGYTQYAWSSTTNEEAKLEEEVPWFEKILFDGKRIKMSFHAWPHLYESEGQQKLYYWTDFQVRYKNELNLDLDAALAEIEAKGKSFFEGSGSAEETTALIVATERAVWQHVEENKENCESLMNDLFVSGSLQSNEKSERWNIDFYTGENLDVTLVVAMPECAETCQWPWINLWFNPKSQEQMDFGINGDQGESNRESFQEFTIEQLEAELRTTLEEMQSQMQRVDSGEITWGVLASNQDKLMVLNEVLSEKYYHQEGEFDQNNKEAFERRKATLSSIVSEFGGKEIEIVQERRYEQRLVTNTVMHQDAWCQNTNEIQCNSREEACIAGACTYALGGNEDCENGVDDDEDTVKDCDDPDCAISCGKFCQSVCNGDCGECKGNCYETSCQECWNCDWQNNDAYCSGICESSGCNACSESCMQQSFCSECKACEESLQTLQVEECSTECTPCTDCRAQYENSSEEADSACAEICDPCTLCKAPTLYTECYQTCDAIATGGQRETCYGLCDEEVLFVCNGQQQYSPCEDTTYICEGIVQPFPCEIYSCETSGEIQKQTVPCGQEFCGENQILENGICVCTPEFYDCDSDGKCTDTAPCGAEEELCTDAIDNDGDQLVDCQDISPCESLSCGEESVCHEGVCLMTEELAVCADGEVLQEGICRKLCNGEEECTETEFCSYGYCSSKKSCTMNEECYTNQECLEGFCEESLEEEVPLETGESCTLESDCSGERDICSNGVCKEIPLENYNQLVEDGLLVIPENEEISTEFIEQEEQNEEEQDVFPVVEEEPVLTGEDVGASITGFMIWAMSGDGITGRAISCLADEECGENQGCDTFRGECYCKDTFFDCNSDEGDGCESSDPTCAGTRELCPGGCGAEQYCDEGKGRCECTEGFYNCDGLWWDCESEIQCSACTSAEDCAQPTCAPYDSARVITFACVKGSSWEENAGALSFSGGCTAYPTGVVEPWIHFDTWGEPFDDLNAYRAEIEQDLGNEWCKQEKDSALQQRTEIEQSLKDPAFMEKLFTQLLTEDMREWEAHTEAIYTMYWSIVENTRQLARSSQCLEEEFPTLTPLQLKYEFEAGSIELWEEPAYAEEFEMNVLTPYMKLGIFPPKELIKEEFQKAAKEGHFPGPEGEQDGPSAQELEEIRADPERMQYIRDLTAEYADGSLDMKITIIDQEEPLFTIDMSISEENLMQIVPVASYEKEADITIQIDFDFVYGLISEMEKDPRIEHPEWVEESFQDNIGEILDGSLVAVKIASGFATGDISVSPLSKVGTAIELLGHMFGEGPGLEEG